MRSDKSRKRFVFLCVAPATILFFIFMILPTLNVFRMSLYERGAYSPNETFVGLKNFQHLLKDTQFIRSMQNMILLVVVVTIITFAFALVFAAILTREKIKGQNFFRIIFYIPNILSVVVIAGIFSAIYKPENGMLNSIIGLFRDMTDPILWMVAADFGASGSRENADLFPLGIQLRKFVQCRRLPFLLVHQHGCIVTIQLFQLLVQLSRFRM